MDVIINNATPAQITTPQFSTPMQATPYGYGPYGPGFRPDHDGPGFGFFVLLGAGVFLLMRSRRKRQMWRRMGRGGPPALIGAGAADWDRHPDQHAGQDRWKEDLHQRWQQSKQKFFGDGAVDIARERYARGEINEADYQALLRGLMGQEQAAPAQGRPAATPEATAPADPTRTTDQDKLI